MKVNSKQLLHQLHHLNRRIAEVVKHSCASLDAKQLNWRANEESWGVGQGLAHLVATNAYYLPAIKKALAYAQKKGLKPQETFESSWLGKRTVRIFQLTDINQVRWHIKSPSRFSPKSQIAPDVVSTFLHQQEQLLGLIEQAHQYSLKKTKIPLAILRFVRLRLGDAFRLVSYHNERHLVQLLRVRYHPDFPRN